MAIATAPDGAGGTTDTVEAESSTDSGGSSSDFQYRDRTPQLKPVQDAVALSDDPGTSSSQTRPTDAAKREADKSLEQDVREATLDAAARTGQQPSEVAMVTFGGQGGQMPPSPSLPVSILPPGLLDRLRAVGLLVATVALLLLAELARRWL